MSRTSAALRRQPTGSGSSSPGSQPARLAHLEEAVATIQQTLDVQFKRMAAMQAELDHLTAKNSNS